MVDLSTFIDSETWVIRIFAGHAERVRRLAVERGWTPVTRKDLRLKKYVRLSSLGLRQTARRGLFCAEGHLFKMPRAVYDAFSVTSPATQRASR